MRGKSLPNQYAFNSGELSPLLDARTDQARYPYGVKRMRNFIPTLQGPARKRGGLKFIGEIADSSQKAWAIPFIYSQTDAWVLEFGNQTLRFYTDRGQVLESAITITGLTNANPGVFTKTSHGLSAGQEVYVATMPGTTGIAGRNFKVNTVPTADTFTLKDMYGTVLDTTSSGTYTGSGTVARVYQIATPWTIANLTDSATGCCLMSVTQSADVLYICVPGFAPRKLTRSAATSWAISTLDQTGGPFETVDPDQTTTVYIDNGAIGTGRTLTASTAIFTSDHVGSLFLLEMKSTDGNGAWETATAFSLNTIVRSQGHYYKCTDAGTSGSIVPSHTEGARYDGADTSAVCQWQYQHSGYGWCKITAIGGGGTTATVDVISTIPDQAVGSGNASTKWAFGSWSTANGFPTHCGFFRSRLYFVRGTRIWFSVPDDFENFTERDAGIIAADSSFVIDIRSGRNDNIMWTMASADLLIGTEGSEHSVSEITSSEPFGPGNAASLAGPGYGSRRVAPVKVNDSVVYPMNAGRILRELRFSFEVDGYSSLDRTAFAEHICKGQINQLAYAREPDSIVYAFCKDGTFPHMSIQPEHDLLAWARTILGGSALVESVAVIPSPAGDRDEVYVIASLTVNAQTKRYIGYFTAPWDEDVDALEDSFYVDFGLTYDGSSTTSITGLHHLEGATVQVLADGHYIGTKTVSGGGITLDQAASVVQAGLGYTATIESMNVMRPGVIARTVHFWIRFKSTVSALWSMAMQKERSTETTTAAPIEFGNVVLSGVSQPVTRLVKGGGAGHARDLRWIIEHSEPTACIISGVTLEQIETKDA